MSFASGRNSLLLVLALRLRMRNNTLLVLIVVSFSFSFFFFFSSSMVSSRVTGPGESVSSGFVKMQAQKSRYTCPVSLVYLQYYQEYRRCKVERNRNASGCQSIGTHAKSRETYPL
ncbi:hypothetical protein BDW74DRAFT_72533 [Aspergillus multicolor]|uniref:uncharacterized protein n=1 Tax=Aspergillus multicolor TaxID=41759 RepID=UPI003CCD0F75